MPKNLTRRTFLEQSTRAVKCALVTGVFTSIPITVFSSDLFKSLSPYMGIKYMLPYIMVDSNENPANEKDIQLAKDVSAIVREKVYEMTGGLMRIIEMPLFNYTIPEFPLLKDDDETFMRWVIARYGFYSLQKDKKVPEKYKNTISYIVMDTQIPYESDKCKFTSLGTRENCPELSTTRSWGKIIYGSNVKYFSENIEQGKYPWLPSSWKTKWPDAETTNKLFLALLHVHEFFHNWLDDCVCRNDGSFDVMGCGGNGEYASQWATLDFKLCEENKKILKEKLKIK